eukprot:GGOE01010670.1.p1 GENE.GGOE01010670.1~~GGOE01010670.1.p1  ORF type:complete len:805 (+),score=182.10 GGOE01010670.1:67-2481(+)
MTWGAVLDDGPLLAPCCYHLPPTLDPVRIYGWIFHLEVQVVEEIFTLSSKSVLYEMALHCLQRPWYRQVAADSGSGNGLAALTCSFSEALRGFEHTFLLAKCRLLFLNHLEAGLSCIRFRLALERLLPADGAQPAATNRIVKTGSSLSAAEGPDYCVAEEVDREKWVFRDADDDGLQGLDDHPGSFSNGCGSAAGPTQRLFLGGEAKLAYSVTLFVWAAMHLLTRRVEMLQEFPVDHPLFAPARARDTPKISSLGDSFETLVIKRSEVAQRAVGLYRQQEWQQALEEFTRALAMPLDEGRYMLFRFRAGCYFHLHQYEEAIEDCNVALVRNPNAFAPLFRRAQACQALGRLESARADLTLLLRYYPGSVGVQALQAQLAEGLPSASPQLPFSQDNAHSMSAEDAVSHGATTTTSSSRTQTQDPNTPVSSSSGRALSFPNSRLSINLATLPVNPEPLDVEDPPYLRTYLDRGTLLEYTICGGKELGRGASGRVYKAVHPVWGWFMAVKEFEAKRLDGVADLLSAFDLMATMKHNNVVRCLGMRRLPGHYQMVMEFCSGGSLRGLINDLQGLPLPLVRKYAVEVLRGLRYIHDHGLLHRDIKASNVLLRDDGVAKVADFGTVLKIPEEETPACGSVKGTVLWMAPETFRGRYSTASDMWSFGCMLIEMATANDPWHEQQFQEQLTAMVFIATRPDALPSIPPQLNEDLGTHFFHCCVARDPMERCSADLLLRHLWLSSIEPRSPASPVTTNATSIQGCYRDKSADKERGYPWTTCTSITESALLVTTASASLLVESLTDDTAHGGQ